MGGESSAAGSGSGGSPFDGLGPRPDVDTTPVADCAGQNDLTLCQTVTTPDRSYDICVAGQCVSPGCGDPSCNSPAPHFLVPPASDHVYFMPGSGDEPVVVDFATGLHWQACTAGWSGPQCETGMRGDMTWDAALAYCDALSWGGKDDWYLPDSWELLSIVDFGKVTAPPVLPGSIALDPALFPNPTSQYWTSHYASDIDVFGLQLFGADAVASFIVLTQNRTEELGVRCARRGFSRDAGYADERFLLRLPEAEDQTVIEDFATGLVWQGCLSGRSGVSCEQGTLQELTMPDWRPYCDDLVWAGWDDWRLPTFKELHTLAQYPPLSTFDDPEVDEEIFNVDGVNYLAATSGWGPDAVDMLFDTYDGDKTIPTGDYPIMCVRWK